MTNLDACAVVKVVMMVAVEQHTEYCDVYVGRYY